ncbi:MAG TPA: hypothetical protein PLV92_04045, partial [Pirellulaceae bacterium]|nr:hypothetical protein [Pirellulaceae bacterium]
QFVDDLLALRRRAGDLPIDRPSPSVICHNPKAIAARRTLSARRRASADQSASAKLEKTLP